ncbi:MAG: transcriptional repressor [Synergistaceae bacterium]|jgi:Fur family ferric uptake transcriptional regulator|nr:transcriptional repressor [Synergistaceae bacterium]
MNRPSAYNTKQSKAILDYIASLDGRHITTKQIVEHFENTEFSVGLTTIYRHLDKLVASGAVRKYVTDGVSGACYQYAADGGNCSGHFHLKCECCGALTHLQCEKLDEIPKHIFDEHSFKINENKSVFYGKCAVCLKKSTEI